MTEHAKETFLKDVSNHSMSIVKDDGAYRHLIFSNNGSSFYRFDIVTWPGYLAFTGDMGSFVFSRVEDMFCFFRNKRKEINLGYWAEKVVAEDKDDGVKRFSLELFRENILHVTKNHLSLEEEDEIPQDVMNEIEGLLNAEDYIDAIALIRDFRSEKVSFNDWWEFSNNEYAHRFVWCCHALVWAIDKYDAHHAAVQE